MTTPGDIQDYEGFEYVCTHVEGGNSFWVRKDHMPKYPAYPVGIGYEVVD